MVVFGPLFVAGGFLAAFTEPGAWFVFIGLGMVVAGVALLLRLPVGIAAAAGLAVAAAFIVPLELRLHS